MDKQKINEIEINGIIYIPKNVTIAIPQEENEIKWNDELWVRKTCINTQFILANKVAGMQAVLIRSYAAGVHFGYLKETKDTLAGKISILVNTRRIWYWDGAASLSQIALEGVNKPQNCKISVILEENEIVNVIETIPLTKKALDNLYKVSVWKQ